MSFGASPFSPSTFKANYIIWQELCASQRMRVRQVDICVHRQSDEIFGQLLSPSLNPAMEIEEWEGSTTLHSSLFGGVGHCSSLADEVEVVTLFPPDMSTIAFTSLLYESI